MSKAEAFGLVLQEANSFGLPLILNNIDGMKFVANKKYTVFVARFITKQNFLKSYESYKNKSKYKNFSYNSFLSSHNNSWDAASKKFAKLINNVL